MMTKPVIILGAGGHAKVLAEIMGLSGTPIIGFSAPSVPDSLSKTFIGIPHVGDDAAVLQYSADEVALVNGVGSVGSSQRRESVFHFFQNQGYEFPVVVHPSAVISAYAVLREGAQVMAGAV